MERMSYFPRFAIADEYAIPAQARIKSALDTAVIVRLTRHRNNVIL